MNNLFNNYNISNLMKHYITITCPSCGEICESNTQRCIKCSYNLKEYKDLILTKYTYFNEAYDLIKQKDYFNALVNIIKYLTYEENDEDANKLYIYLLVKNNKLTIAKKEMLKFEEKFPRSPFIMDVELSGLKNIDIPKITKKNINIEKINNPFEKIQSEYTKYRMENTNDIINLSNEFNDIIRISDQKKYKEVIDFYEKKFLKFLAKKEIRIESHNGRVYSELTDEEIQTITVLGTKKCKTKKDNTIETISPAIYLRSKIIKKQDVIILKKK